MGGAVGKIVEDDCGFVGQAGKGRGQSIVLQRLWRVWLVGGTRPSTPFLYI